MLDIAVNGEFTDEFPSISGEHLVGPDGTINLGAFGQVYVSDKTIREVTKVVQKAVARHVRVSNVVVDVLAYNSKKYYIVIEGPGASAMLCKLRSQAMKLRWTRLQRLGACRALVPQASGSPGPPERCRLGADPARRLGQHSAWCGVDDKLSITARRSRVRFQTTCYAKTELSLAVKSRQGI